MVLARSTSRVKGNCGIALENPNALANLWFSMVSNKNMYNVCSEVTKAQGWT
jgi:hypothetical protein